MKKINTLKKYRHSDRDGKADFLIKFHNIFLTLHHNAIYVFLQTSFHLHSVLQVSLSQYNSQFVGKPIDDTLPNKKNMVNPVKKPL